MKSLRLILGGILTAVWTTAALAQVATGGPQTETRPLSRGDASVLRQEAQLAALRAIKPAVRPDYMLRYPVEIETRPATVRPLARQTFLPEARWDHKNGSERWTWAAMSALRAHGSRLEETVPRDIANWCPAYVENPPVLRRAFWVGMMSALAKHESTYRPEAVGGGNLWYGLLQIYPDTARRYGCRATTGEALKDPASNLSCAIRIMNVTVPRDNAIAVRDSRWRGVAADWGPMTNRGKIADMAAWTRQQDYCEAQTTLASSIRPLARPTVDATLSTMNDG